MNVSIRIQPRPHRQIEPGPAPVLAAKLVGGVVWNPMISKRVAMMWLAVLRAYAVHYLHPNLAVAQIARGKRTNTNLPISTIADALGLNDPAYFSRLFSGATGLSPRSFATNSIVGREQWLS
jgi:hypothetical protein